LTTIYVDIDDYGRDVGASVINLDKSCDTSSDLPPHGDLVALICWNIRPSGVIASRWPMTRPGERDFIDEA